MRVKIITDAKEAGGNKKINTKIILILRETFPWKEAQFYYRVTFEDPDNRYWTTTSFFPVQYLCRLPRGKLGLQIRLPHDKKTTCVEVIDTTSSVSCALMMTHGEYKCPYAIQKAVASVVKISMPLDLTNTCDTGDIGDTGKSDRVDQHDKNFCINILDMADISSFLNEAGSSSSDSHSESESESESPSNYDPNFDPASPSTSTAVATSSSKKGARKKRKKTIQVIATKKASDVAGEIDPILKMVAEYDKNKIAFFDNHTGNLVSGLYWCNYAHWLRVNETLFSTPFTYSCAALRVETQTPAFIYDLTHAYLGALKKNTLTGATPHPKIGILQSRYLDEGVTGLAQSQIYGIIADITFAALEKVVADKIQRHVFSDSHQEDTDFGKNFVSFTQTHTFDLTEETRNPFSPWLNTFLRKRWALTDYVEMAANVSDAKPYYDGEWITFYVRKRRITGIKYGLGIDYPQRERQFTFDDNDDIAQDFKYWQTVCSWLSGIAKMDQMPDDLDESVRETAVKIFKPIMNNDTLPITCHLNTFDGHLYIQSPILGLRCLHSYPPDVQAHEQRIVWGHIKTATDIMNGANHDMHI